jgi:hypothetical protein
MKQKIINLYQFEELTQEQQEKCIEKHRDFNDDILCNLTEFDDMHRIKLEEQGFLCPKISYDMSYSQGSGASFTCEHLNYEILLKDYNCKHKNWIMSILEQYAEIKIERSYSCHYVHEKSCDTNLYEYTQYNYERIISELEKIRDHIEEKRLLACSILYNDLEAEIDYLTSDEAIKEALISNEYYFNAETLEIES